MFRKICRKSPHYSSITIWPPVVVGKFGFGEDKTFYIYLVFQIGNWMQINFTLCSSIYLPLPEWRGWCILFAILNNKILFNLKRHFSQTPFYILILIPKWCDLSNRNFINEINQFKQLRSRKNVVALIDDITGCSKIRMTLGYLPIVSPLVSRSIRLVK